MYVLVSAITHSVNDVIVVSVKKLDPKNNFLIFNINRVTTNVGWLKELLNP
jgi:hypothetical protein